MAYSVLVDRSPAITVKSNTWLGFLGTPNGRLWEQSGRSDRRIRPNGTPTSKAKLCRGKSTKLALDCYVISVD